MKKISISLKQIISLTLLIIFSMELQAQNNLLGKIEFPNSGSEEAQSYFMDGMKFMHNFEYADAARSFQKAREMDPNFAMAYYGEAKSFNHPIWQEQDRDAAMEVLKKLGTTVADRQAKAPTQREKDYLMTLEVLYGNTPESEGLSKEERDDLYLEAMEEMHEKYPNDHEVTTFYGLAILGSAHEGRDFAIYMKAAAELMDVWNANKEHPGAAHYLIHSFDDPIHAPLGLPMAKAYSKIAPSAAHAQHMTSHIFLALGMWEDVIDANIVARNVQNDRREELNEPEVYCGHYTWWLQYGYLQDGNVDAAERVLNTCRENLSKESTYGTKWHFGIMRGHHIVDTEDWGAADEWTFNYEESAGEGMIYHYTSALAAINTGDIQKAKTEMERMLASGGSEDLPVMEGQLKSLLMIEAGETEEGLALLNETVAMEAAMPIDFGPPSIIKPSYELLGDVLAELGHTEEAAEAYEQQLARTPDRRRSLEALKELSE